MDSITALATSVQNPLIAALGHLLDNDLLYAVLIVAFVLIFEWKNDKRTRILLSLVLAYVLIYAVKLIIAMPRPCAGEVWCPQDFSFPSAHAGIALTLMLGFMKKKSYLFFLLFAICVSFTRLNIGVHSFFDILGAIPIAIIAYYATNISWEWLEKNVWLKNRRKSVRKH